MMICEQAMPTMYSDTVICATEMSRPKLVGEHRSAGNQQDRARSVQRPSSGRASAA